MTTDSQLDRLRKLLSPQPMSGGTYGPLGLGIGSVDPYGARVRYVNENIPQFYLYLVPEMIRHPAVRLGLGVLRGVMAEARYDVQCSNPEQADYIAKQLDTYRSVCLQQALRSMEYGWVPLEVMFKQGEQYIELDRMEYRHPRSVRPILRGQRVVGGQFHRPKRDGGQPDLNLPCPKCFWVVHRHHEHPIWGSSQLDGPHVPFLDHASVGGFGDSRRLYLRKLVIPPTVIYHPPSQTTGADGVPISNKDIAAEAAANFLNASVLTIQRDPSGAEAWGVEKLGDVGDYEGIEAVNTSIEDEIWMAMEIPPEVIRTDGTGSYNGREIPMLNLLNICHAYLVENSIQFKSQVLDHLVSMAFGPLACPYTVTVRPLREFMTEGLGDKDPEGGAANGPPPPPNQEEGDGDSPDEDEALDKNDKSGQNNGNQPKKKPSDASDDSPVSNQNEPVGESPYRQSGRTRIAER